MKIIFNNWLFSVTAILILTSCGNEKEKETSVQLKDSALEKISQKK